MAKLWGPMHSDDARGKLADAIVYIGWRGIKDARMWKKPANPRTAAQQTQRGYFTSAVADYHTLKASDLVGWSNRAAGQPYSGFNLYVDRFVTTKVAGLLWNTVSSISAVAATTAATVKFKLEVSASAKVKAGTTAGTWLIEQVAATAKTAHAITLTGLTSKTKYYYYIEQIKASYKGESGWHTFTTL